MKTFSLSVACLSFLFISCSTDDTITAEKVNQNSSINPQAGLREASSPKNIDNIYDSAGKMYADILDDYLSRFTPTALLVTVIGDVEYASGANSTFYGIRNTYTGITSTTLGYVLSKADAPEDVIAATTSTSALGKVKLENFTDLLDGFETADYEDIYDDIITFESSIISNTALTEADKQVILATTSVARYSIDYDKEKARDWGKTKSGIVGAINGGNVNIATAVITSVSANAAD
jgi:hypothetical protein